MTIGIGIGLGLTRQRASLLRTLTWIFGNDIVSLAMEMPVNSSGGLITGVTSMIGPAYSYSPNSVGQYKSGILAGRIAAYEDDAINRQKSLRAVTTSAVKSLWRASYQVSRPSIGGALNLLTNSTINAGLVKTNGTSLTWMANGWTFYNNGAQTSSITYGEARLYEADLVASVATGVSIGGYYGDYTPRDACPDLSMFTLALSAVPTAEQRALATYKIRKFLRI